MKKIISIILAANIAVILMNSDFIPSHTVLMNTDNEVYVDETYITICGQHIIIEDNLE